MPDSDTDFASVTYPSGPMRYAVTSKRPWGTVNGCTVRSPIVSGTSGSTMKVCPSGLAVPGIGRIDSSKT